MINMRELLEHKKKNNKMSFYSYNQKGKNSRTIKTEFSTRETMKEYKRCSTCGEYKLFKEFSKGGTRGNQRGLQAVCKRCNQDKYETMCVGIYKQTFQSVLGDYKVEYIGKSNIFYSREKVHTSNLRKGKHTNKELQKEFDAVVNHYKIDRNDKKAMRDFTKNYIEFEMLIDLTEEECLDKYLLKLEKEVQQTRLKEIEENKLNIRVVS